MIIVSDSDVRVLIDFLLNVVAPLRDANVGAVSCFYRLANPTTRAMQWEAVAINADFWSQVLQSRSLKPIDFALGAVMATPRKPLEAMGGFKALVDYLADDFQLGNRIVQQGGRNVLSTLVVECWESPKDWREVWRHQLRWARTIRVCRPGPYFLSILGNATLWPLLWGLVEWPGIHSSRSAVDAAGGFVPVEIFVPAGAWMVVVCLLVRVLTALKQQQKLARSRFSAGHFWLIPLKDLLNAALWMSSFLGNTVEWRGQRYRVERGGHLVKIT